MVGISRTFLTGTGNGLGITSKVVAVPCWQALQILPCGLARSFIGRKLSQWKESAKEESADNMVLLEL